MQLLFDMRPDRPGYRLQRLEIFNWGTFDSSDGQVYQFEPEGRTSLLVGQNGSGKSTLVDAILTLMVPSNIRNYNVAAGARKTERSEKSYIRGACGQGSDESDVAVTKFLRRKGKHLSALMGIFQDEQLGRAFTLCQVLHLNADGSTDKIFAFSDDARTLSADLSGIQSSDSIRSHLQQLGYRTTKKFVEYHEWFTGETHIRGKAMDMFNQTVAVKDIQSLNEFIRRHMLEAHDWRDKVQKLLMHFEELSTAHRELVRVRRAEELLVPVEKTGARYEQHATELTAAESQLEAADTFFREQTLFLFEPQIEQKEEERRNTIALQQRLRTESAEAAESIRQIKNEIDEAGGQRLRDLPRLIELEQQRLALKRRDYQEYHKHLRACGLADQINASDTFLEMREKLHTVAGNAEKHLLRTSDEHEDNLARRGQLRVELREEEEESELLSRRQTNLPGHLATLRTRLCEDLQLAEADLPFAAELISVDPEHRRWEASAEMVLRSFAMSLLVPDRLYRRVRGYVEQTRLADARGSGQRLVYLRVGRGAPEVETGDRIHPQSLLRKLSFRSGHDLVLWVKGELRRRFDYRCCESVDEFNEVTRLAMTENRHVKVGADRHEKDDRTRTADPRHFVLGWDNQAKRRRLAERIDHLRAEIDTADKTIERLAAVLEESRVRRTAAAAALEFGEFDVIDVNRHQHEIAELEQERAELESSNKAVQALRRRLSDAEQRQQELGNERDEVVKQEQRLSTEIDLASQRVSNARELIEKVKSAGQYKSLTAHFEAIEENLGDEPLSTLNLFAVEKKWTTKIRSKLEKLRKSLEPLKDRLIDAMVRYLREFKEEQEDLSASAEALTSFLGLLDQIRREDLPRHEKRFKDRLNDKVSQEVALFNGALRREANQIEEKVQQLNIALKEVEYHTGTHMRLEPRGVNDREISDFKRSLLECLDESLENSDEANEARFVRIERLVSRLADKEKTRWRDKVIDVRRWYDFAAREVETETGETRSYYEDSSGQSGGEKAKLAFTILVAAIAYQYDLDPTGRTPGRFHFVVVDEMFSKVDDRYAQYALKLFEQFGLQLLIVAPLDAKARVTEPFVDRYLHVVKDEQTNRSQLFSMTAHEYKEVVESFIGGGKVGLPKRVAR